MTAGDVEVAARAARAAAGALVALRGCGLGGRPLGDAGDAAAQEAIVAVLTAERPDDVVFSEEAVDDRRRLAASRVWIVDPLDGTREYGEEDRHDWAVHVALWSSGELTAAAVALPGLGELLLTDPAPRLPARADGPVRIAVSRSRPPPSPMRSPRRSAPSSCRWGRPATRPSRWPAARSTPTCTPVACTSGTPPRRWPSPGPPG
ncbi:inositol monophosphatase family protein [Blastococcus sp. PRF04-17]|uniref:inositol monophosphatase family protein n=1 Tax=Blastococcus sp. PRF04-17 TaxID=2933797 RepID=UPI001FF4CE62|nr:inositol monophosphatase family protein [Blastococcus sp. PRF04-17]UOY00894.1 hypothetical protein MVA48_18225 [Blastococcus sp. PRF04-17]